MSYIPKNWARNFRYGAHTIHEPDTLEQLQRVAGQADQCRVLGTRHCFNRIADTPEHLISLRRLNKILELDNKKNTVTVEGGITYGRLCSKLHQKGYALHNLASLPHISVAGAIATATHGSGVKHGNLATAVSAVEIITSDGRRECFAPNHGNDEDQPFNGAVVALGALGVASKITLKIQSKFKIKQWVYEKLDWAQMHKHFDEIMAAAYSVSLFTDWKNDYINQVWLKKRDDESDPPRPFFGAKPAQRKLHPIKTESARNCTQQLGRAGPWHKRLPHFRLQGNPGSSKEIQTEYMVPRQHALGALDEVYALRGSVKKLLQICEIRAIAADKLWMSPCYKQECIGIHFTWKRDWRRVSKLLPKLEERLHPFQARPHWGKTFTMPPKRVRPLYERLPQFVKLLERFDPSGKFRNEFLDAYVFGTQDTIDPAGA